MPESPIHRIVEAVWRMESAKIIAKLARMLRNVGLAEEFAQDAMVTALEQWPRNGAPDNPGAWLMATAKNRALDELRRREKAATRELDAIAAQRRRLPNFDLFLRLLDEKRYEGLLFADISAMTQYNRRGKPLTTILQREDLHERLVNGSDYPLPAINVLIRTGTLVRQGYITTEQRACLNEIYDYNPLLFDFALKRAIKIPGTAKRLPASIFMNNSSLDVGISRSR